VLDLFILSLLDRGLQSPYDLLCQGGLSLGSTIPALRRLEKAGLVKKNASVGSSRRPRHGYQLSAPGRKLARSGWIPLLKDQPPTDLDAVLRLADLASYYGAKVADIASLFQRAAQDRVVMSKQASAGKVKVGTASLLYVATKDDWDVRRLATETRFLAGLARSVMQKDNKNPKRGLTQHASGARR
jgi:DNA-binding PadR family transcriptional regulator